MAIAADSSSDRSRSARFIGNCTEGMREPFAAAQAQPPRLARDVKEWEQLFALVSFQIRTVFFAIVEALRLLLPLSLRGNVSTAGCTFYEGMVAHTRAKPVHHTFSYAVRYCLIDMEAAGGYAKSLLSAGERLSLAQARALSGCRGRVRVLLMPESAGYEQNPIAVYYCYDERDELQCGIAEVRPRGSKQNSRVHSARKPVKPALMFRFWRGARR